MFTLVILRSPSLYWLLLVLVWNACLVTAAPANATTPRWRTQLAQLRQRNYQFRTPPSRGAPGTAGSGASRDDCLKLDSPILQAVTPIAADKTVGGVTISDRPQFWFYTNFPSQCFKYEFVLQNDRGRVLVRQPVTNVPTAVLFAVNLPTTISLKPQQTYRWTLQATSLTKPENPVVVVTGWVQRVEAPIAPKPSMELARDYAKAGIWHEAVSTLQCLFKQDPTNLEARELWIAIIRDAGLPSFLEMPMP